MIRPLFSQALPWGDDFDSGSLENWTIIDDTPYSSGPSSWGIINGALFQNSNIFTTENEYSVFKGTHIIAGDASWQDYYFNVRITSTDDDGIGMLFRYQDPDNYYRFITVADPGNQGPFKRLEKQIDGVFYTLAESTSDIKIPGSFIGKIRVTADSIYVYEEENILFSVQDNTFSQGMIGLMCYANNGAMFDDVYISEQDTVFKEKVEESPEILVAERRLRVRGFTYNIWGNQICSPAQIAELISSLDLDFAGLQECSFAFGLEVSNITGMHMAIGADCVLLSKTPFTKIKNLPVSGINVWTNIDSQTVSIYNFHIPWDEAGDRAARIMVDDLFSQDSVPLQIAVGDFNDEHYSTQINILEEHMRYGLADLGWAPSQRVTWPAFDFYGGEGAQTIDLIFCNKASKGRLTEGEIINLSPILSDHKPVWGTVVFPARAAGVTPQISRVAPYFGPDLIEIWFDQDLEKTSAEDADNYTIMPLDGGTSVSVSEASLIKGFDRIRLRTSAHQPGKRYQITVNGVKDKYDPATTVNSTHEYYLRENLLKNPQAENGIDDWLSVGGFMAVSERENQLPYLGSAFFTGHDLEAFSGGSQEIDLSSWAEQIDQGYLAAEWNCYFTTGYEALGTVQASRAEPYDEAEMLIDFIDDSGDILLQASSKRWDTLFWHPYGETSFLPPGTRRVGVHLNSYRKTANGNSNDAAFENAFFTVKELPQPHPYRKNLLTNPSAETGDMEGWNVSGNMQTLTNEVNKAISVSGNYLFACLDAVAAGASQTIEMSEFTTLIDEGKLSVKWGGYMRDFRGDEAAQIELDFLDQNKESIADVSTGLQKVAEWWYYDSLTAIPPGTRKIQYTFNGKAYFDFLHLIPVVSSLTGMDERTQILKKFNLAQNYPNPFNPKTTIKYELQITNDVELSVYNILGQRVFTLVSEKQNAGHHQVQWDADGFSSGIYYYKLNSGEFQQVKKMMLLK